MADGKKKQANDLHSLRREFKEGLESVSTLLKDGQASARATRQRIDRLYKRLSQNQP